MTKASHAAEYARRMHRALEYIDQNLDRPLGIAELAEIAHFSPFHFHRIFSNWLGETFGEYLRRRRLEVAASCLVGQPQLAVLAVALSVGFGSAEAFSRAFKLRFGVTPTAWRRREATVRLRQGTPPDSNDDQSMSKTNQAPDRALRQSLSNVPTSEKHMKVVVVERKPTKVAYLRHIGPYGEPISRFWQDVVYPWIGSNGLLGQPRFGVSHDDPSVTAPDKCRYDAAVELSGPLRIPGRSMTSTLPGGAYGVVSYQGTAAEIGVVWNQLLRDWLPASGLQLAARPFLECYDNASTFDAKTGVFTCELAIPVAPL